MFKHPLLWVTIAVVGMLGAAGVLGKRDAAERPSSGIQTVKETKQAKGKQGGAGRADLNADTLNDKRQTREHEPDCSKSQSPADCLVQLWVARATQQQADTAWWSGIVSVLTLAATGLAAGAAIAAVVYSAQSATSAGAAAKASVRSADAAEHALRGLERPYLFIEKIDAAKLHPPTEEDRPQISYRIRNYGKTPAILRSLSMRLQRIDPNTVKLRLPLHNIKKYYTVVEPGHRLAHRSGKDVAEMDVEGSQPGRRFDGLLMASLVLYGSLHYEDPTGAYHIDEFCLQGNKDGQSWDTVYRKRKTTYPKQERHETDT